MPGTNFAGSNVAPLSILENEGPLAVCANIVAAMYLLKYYKIFRYNFLFPYAGFINIYNPNHERIAR